MKQILIFMTCLLVFSSCATPPKAVNKEAYGTQAPEIWMPLNQFEYDTFNKAKKGLDEETKFKLALFFTGDSRSQEEFTATWNNYQNFIKKCDQGTSSVQDIKEKGKIIHKLFVEIFIKNHRERGYQSKGIGGLILSQEYDMNTSALLFGLVAEKYGFSVKYFITKGDKDVITSKRTKLSMEMITGSIYTQISHPDLENPVNVYVNWETGYNITLDKDFFIKLKKDNPDIIKDADLEYKRYQEAKVYSLNEMLIRQYKIDKAYEVVDLDFAPGFRRTEMAAQLTNSCEILIDRAWGWQEMYYLLHKMWKEGENLPFVDLIQNELERTRTLCEKDESFKRVAGSLYLYSAQEYAQNGNGEKLKTAIANAYKYIDTKADDYENHKSWLIHSVHNYLDKIIEKGLIDQEVDNVNIIIHSIPDVKTQKAVLASFYYHAGQSFFKKEDYWKAGYFYKKCSEFDEGNYKKTCVGNGAISYLNYAVGGLNNGKCSKAKKGLKSCNEKFPESEYCKEIQKLVESNCN